MDDEEKSKRVASDLIDQLRQTQEDLDSSRADAAAVLDAIKADFNREMKDQLEKMEELKKERVMERDYNSKSTHSFDFIDFIKPVFFGLAAISSILTVVIASKPDFIVLLLDNPVATSLGAVSIVAFAGMALVNLLQSRSGRDSFVEIDEKLFNKNVMQDEVEKSVQTSRIRNLEEKYAQLMLTMTPGVDADKFAVAANEPDITSRVALEGNSFEQYMAGLTKSLETHINVSETKASLLLDKGTTYLWRGIAFYVLSIVVWQVVTSLFKVGEFAVWGMVSCSLTFLVVEFLAAWFLRQYKSFTDASFNLVRVKSVFNRYFLSYLAIKEFSISNEGLTEMRAQMLKVIEEDIKWLEPAPQKLGELNHMVAMFESVSGLVEKLKMPSKNASSATTS